MLETLRQEYNQIERENERRKAVRDQLYKELDAAYGTHDLAELKRLMDSERSDYEKKMVAYEAKIAEIRDYIEEKRKELGI